MAAKTGNNYTSGALADSVEIPTPNSGFSMMTRLIKYSQMIATTIDYQKIARLAPTTTILPFPVVGRCRNRLRSVSSRWAWSKTPDLPLELSSYLS